MMLTCRASPRLDEIEMKSGGTLVRLMRFFSTALWPTPISSHLLRDGCQDLLQLLEAGGLDQVVIEAGFQ